ncbi:MAG: hypothetical protein GW949_00395 [Spirochaetales bacterium]|nr:hypothetical protein [Spirochaetales bacterium]
MAETRPTLYIRPNVIYLSRGLSRDLNSDSYSFEVVSPGKAFKIRPKGEVRPFASDKNSIARRFLEDSFPVGRYLGKQDGDGFLFHVSDMDQPEPRRTIFRNPELNLPSSDRIIEEPIDEQTINRMIRLLRTRRHSDLEIVAAILRHWKSLL